jgi:hypothetical protein
MVYIPSANIMYDMLLHGVGFWIDKPLNEDKGCLILKLPDHVIRSVFSGAAIQLRICIAKIKQMYFKWLSFRVFDDPNDPTEIEFIFTKSSDYDLFLHMIEQASFNIHFFDERIMLRLFPHHRLAAIITFPSTEPKIILDKLSNTQPTYTEELMSLDELWEGENKNAAKDYLHAWITIPLQLGNLQAMTSREDPFFKELSVSNPKEGSNYEVLIAGSLAPLYPSQTFHSPHYSKKDELSDILAFNEESICFIQAKTLQMLSMDKKRPLGERIEKLLIENHSPSSAIRQAGGAIRNLRSDTKIFTDNKLTQEIIITGRTTSTIHGIILIPEMHYAVSWDLVAKYLLDISNEEKNTFIQVMDLAEFQKIVLATLSPKKFGDILLNRWKAMKLHQNAYVAVDFVIGDENQNTSE